MSSARLKRIVLRSPRLEAAKAFYEALGLSFVPEKHGPGPSRFSASLGGLILELYPSGKEPETGDLRLGFDVSGLPDAVARLIALGVDVPAFEARSVVVVDPDGRRVELTEGGSS